MSLTASSASITDVSLVDAFGSGEVSGRVEPRGGGEFLAQFDTIPSGVFVVRVKGQADSDAKDSTVFQRQSSTTHQSSNLTVKVRSNPLPLTNGFFNWSIHQSPHTHHTQLAYC